MMDSIQLSFNRTPSILSTYIFGLLKPRFGLQKGKPLPRISSRWLEFKINEKHLSEYTDICGLIHSREVPMLYLNTVTFPLHMSMITHRKFPLYYPKMLMIRNHIIQNRPMNTDETMDICCEIAQDRIVQKGLEMDIYTAVTISGKSVWENVNTYFFRGRFGKEKPTTPQFNLNPMTDATLLADWTVPSGIGWRFARVSYDYNGIHYSSLYARLNGFKRDFAAGGWILTNCIKNLPQFPDSKPVRLDALYKGPVYYESHVVLKGAYRERKRGIRFDLYCGDNPRPCICGDIATVEPGSEQYEMGDLDHKTTLELIR
jgi:hypothetical protein